MIELKRMKQVILIALILLTGVNASAQSISGTVTDADTQMVVNRVVHIYTDSIGVPYPYNDSTLTDNNGYYSFAMPQNIPVGVIFRVTTFNCGTPTVQNVAYPYNNPNVHFNVCATNRYIRGDVYKGTLFNPASLAMVFLIRKHTDSMNTIVQLADSTEVDSNGFYIFTLPLNSADSYLVKAALLPADTADYIYYIPAYYNGVLRWSSASVLHNGNHWIDITLPEGINMQGQGYVVGTVDNSLYKRILILTTDNDVPVAYRYSNTTGEFSFGGLDYGTYKLFGDALGKQNPALVFTLSANNPSISTIVFYESNVAFYGMLWALSVEEHKEKPELTIYPNPVADYLHIKGMENIAGEKNISLYSINGTVVYNKSVEGNVEMLIPFAELTSGLYMLHIKSLAGEYHYKVMR